MISMREEMVPYSFPAQRTNAKVDPGAKLRTRRRRSRMYSATSRPNRIQFSICFSTQINSTRVSVSLGAPIRVLLPFGARNPLAGIVLNSQRRVEFVGGGMSGLWRLAGRTVAEPGSEVDAFAAESTHAWRWSR